MEDSAQIRKDTQMATFIGFLGAIIPLILFSVLAIYVKEEGKLLSYFLTGKYVLSIVAYLATSIMVLFTNPDKSAVAANMKLLITAILMLIILSILYSISDLRLLMTSQELDLRFWLIHPFSFLSIYIAAKLSFKTYSGMFFERVETPNARVLQVDELNKLASELGVEDD